MRNINQKELNEILKKHKMWLNGEVGGERANLRNVNLRGVDLSNTDLRYADLSGADLEDSDLEDVNLEFAKLEDANLEFANLEDANLEYTNLRNTDLIDTDLRDASLRGADLRGADLRGADLNSTNLWNADLRGANLEDVKTNIHTIGYNLACPKEGSFIGYKKANKYIIKLLILEDAKRSSATTCKCRCDKAKVLEIENIKTGERVKKINSDFDPSFIYSLGKIVSVDNFDDDRWHGCSTGIHFFVDKENAINY